MMSNIISIRSGNDFWFRSIHHRQRFLLLNENLFNLILVSIRIVFIFLSMRKPPPYNIKQTANFNYNFNSILFHSHLNSKM